MLLALVIVTGAGFVTKLYRGPARGWVNNSFSGVFYEIFWCLVGGLLAPKARPWKIVLTVFVATCVLEFLQLWHPAWLESVRATFLGRALVGNTFMWSDFPYYVVGCAGGWVLLKGLSRPR